TGRLDRGRVSLQLRHPETGVLGLSHRHAGRDHLGRRAGHRSWTGKDLHCGADRPIVDDPNLTDKKFPGNPTQSYRSREPLRVVGEVTDWVGHSPERLKEMKDRLERLKAQDVEAID